VIADADRGAIARQFARHVQEAVESAHIGSVETEPAVAGARRLVDQGKVAAAFVVPRGFSDAVADGRSARIVIVGNVDAPIGTLVAQSLARGFAARVDAVRVAAAATGARDPAALVDRVPEPVRLVDVGAETKQLNGTTFYAAAMAIFFLFFAVQFGVVSLLEERRDGTLARVLVAPVRDGAVLGGKLLTSLVIGTVSMSLLALATHFALGADWGNPLGVALLIVSGVIAATAVSMLVATFARTPEQAGPWLSMVAVVLGMLGGTFFPVAQAGGLLEQVSLATPHAWFLRGLENLSGGSGPGEALVPALAILAFAFAVGSAAWLRRGRLLTR
jgi:ABC-2 type transport system permease protein